MLGQLQALIIHKIDESEQLLVNEKILYLESIKENFVKSAVHGNNQID